MIDVLTDDGRVCNHRALSYHPWLAMQKLRKQKKITGKGDFFVFEAPEEDVDGGCYRIYWREA